MLVLIEWVNEKLRDPVEWPPPVVAGLLHYNIAEVHPFADGNGRTARLLTSALLLKAGYAPHRLFNFEAHYGKDKDASVRRLALGPRANAQPGKLDAIFPRRLGQRI